MTSLYLTHEELEDSNPLDLIESIIVDNDWSFDRQGNNELTVGVEGSWCQYHLWFSWRSDLRAIHFSCAYDVKIPERQFCIWGGKTPEEAIEAAMFETMGEA